MTIEQLRSFRGIQREMEQIQREIDLLYYPIRSPRSGEGHSQTPSDPTASAVNKIMRLEERLCRLREELADQLDAKLNDLAKGAVGGGTAVGHGNAVKAEPCRLKATVPLASGRIWWLRCARN